ncbi:hypothetical protein K1719_020188 [Acacia pycnantha]|nr:hypothetical protein K1719_043517 [Acacia pycnantha]KAI9108883.1 hypothetical protein K1719_020188 [Acacia pycnantha]
MASQLSASSPGFNSYSSETLAEIAARVLNEFRSDPLSVSDDDLLFDSWAESLDCSQSHHDSLNDRDLINNDDEFEFALVCADPNTSPVSADDIFCNGQIKPMYPIFNHPQFAPSNEVVVVADTSVSSISTTNETVPAPRHRRPPLRKLMFEERETLSCSSSAFDADESDVGGRVVSPQTYCEWSPKSSSAGRRSKKNTSTGSSSSSKRWRLKDLLLRSGSQGSGRKDATVFVSQSKRSSKVAQEVSKPISGSGGEHGGNLHPF